MLRKRIIILPEVRLILDKLHINNHKAYIVGGYVRDSLLKNRMPHDCDICTSATPQEIMDIFKNYKIIPTGLQHGTVTICMTWGDYEVTTFRKDGEYLDGRHPQTIDFVNDLKEDLSRRDFTINALAYNEEEGLIDYFGGKEDLENKIIRCVGNAEKRFKEDGLRILRAYRFSAQLGFTIEYNTSSILAYKGVKTNIDNVSRERIREELNKIILSDNSREVLLNMVDDGICKSIFGDFTFEDMMFFNQNNPYHNRTLLNHTLTAMTIAPPILEVRLALLFHDIGKLQTQTTDDKGISHYYNHSKVSAELALKYLKQLKYDNKTIDMVITLIASHDFTFDNYDYIIKKQLKKLLNKYGEEIVKNLIIIRKCDILAQSEKYYYDRLEKIYKVERLLNDVLEDQECFQIKDLAINGNDLIKIGYEQGVELGKTLKDIVDLVIEEHLNNDKEELLEYAKFNLKTLDTK